MPLPPVSVARVQGLPAFHADIETTFTGTLVFGVGRCDETAATSGTAHLVEHLVMERVGRLRVMNNGTTSDETMSFSAEGAPELVVDFLNRVAAAVRSLGDITDEDVARQRRLIAAELGDDDERPGHGPLLDRFGARSFGLLDFGSPGHRSLSRRQVLDFAAAWLHADNAALCFTGEIPDGLDVMLPPAVPMPDRQTPRLVRGGGWRIGGGATLAVSLALGPAEPRVLRRAMSTIQESLHHRLRAARQPVYSVEPYAVVLNERSRLVAFLLDPQTDAAVDAAASAVRILRDLGRDGPDDETLAIDRARWASESDHPIGQAQYLDGVVGGYLRGRVRADALSDPDVLEASREEIRDAIAAALPTVFVTFGDNVQIADDGPVTRALGLPFVADATPCLATMSTSQLAAHLRMTSVELFRPRPFAGMRGCDLIIDDERITLVVPGEGMTEVRFDEVALALYSRAHRVWSAVALPGHALFLELGQWRGADRLHAVLQRRLPEHLRVDVDADDPR